MVKKSSKKENLELAKEHINIAEDLVVEEGKKTSNENLQKKVSRVEFDLEKAEEEIEDLDEIDED